MNPPEGDHAEKQLEAEAPEPNTPENRVQYQGYDNIGFIAPIGKLVLISLNTS